MYKKKRKIRIAKHIASLITRKGNSYHKKHPITLTELSHQLGFKSRTSVYPYIEFAIKQKYMNKKQFKNWKLKGVTKYKKQHKKRYSKKVSKSYCKTQLSLKQSRRIVRKLGIKSVSEFYKLKKQGHPKLRRVPANPDIYYGKSNLYKKQ